MGGLCKDRDDTFVEYKEDVLIFQGITVSLHRQGGLRAYLLPGRRGGYAGRVSGGDGRGDYFHTLLSDGTLWEAKTAL